MYRLYKKNELNFSLVWIISYVVLFSVADSFSASLGTEKIIAAPVAIVFTLLLLVFVSKHNLKEKYGLCSFNGSLRNFLYFTPLLLIMSINLWNGVTMKLSVLETVLYILSMLCVGFIEEIIFRGFLFKALYNDNVKLAIVISSVTFGIGHIVNACASIERLKATEELMEKYPFVYGAFGIHPDDAEKMTEDTLNEIRHLCHLPKAVAIGEIGLDYYWHKEEREHEIQKKMFRAQMEIAREEKMPFMIHSRDAARDTLELVKECMKEGMHGGIIHCFSYGKEMAREYLNMGLYLGIGGVVTFKNAKKLKEVVEYAPLEQLVLETDSPYLSPEPNRGKRNSSLNLPYVAAMIAELKGISGEEVIAVTEENAKRLLFRK